MQRLRRLTASAALNPYPLMAVVAAALWYGAPGLAGVSDWLAARPLADLAEALDALRLRP